MNAEKQFQEMSSRVMTGSGAGVGIRDCRAETRRLAQLQRGIIQRMAVMAVNNMDEQEDLLVWNNMEHAKAAAPGAVGDLDVHKVWNQLQAGEEIRLVEHGSKEDEDNEGPEKHLIGEVSANAIVVSMTATGNSIPRYPKIRIVCQSCYAGTNGLIEQVCRLLRRKGYPGVEVEGRTGVAFGFKGMNRSGKMDTGSRDVANEEATANENGEDKYFEFIERNRGVASFRHLFKDGWYGKPWEVIPVVKMRDGLEEEIGTEDPKKIWDKLGAEKKMELVAEEMKEYWAACSESMRVAGGFKEETKYVRHIKL